MMTVGGSSPVPVLGTPAIVLMAVAAVTVVLPLVVARRATRHRAAALVAEVAAVPGGATPVRCVATGRMLFTVAQKVVIGCLVLLSAVDGEAGSAFVRWACLLLGPGLWVSWHRPVVVATLAGGEIVVRARWRHRPPPCPRAIIRS